MARQLQTPSAVLVRRALLVALVSGWIGACDLNPQPDLPSGDNPIGPGSSDAGQGAGSTTGAGGAFASGAGGAFAPGAGGAIFGVGGGTGPTDAGTVPDGAAEPADGSADSSGDSSADARTDAPPQSDATGDAIPDPDR